MADYKILVPFLLKFEGGVVDDPADAGGFTNKGVTLKTYKAVFGQDKTKEDLVNITDEEWGHIFKIYYWDKLKADHIDSQSVANIIVDWGFNAGVETVAKKVQAIVGAKVDGCIGNQTISLINLCDPRDLFDQIKESRIRFYKSIVERNPSQKKFLKGWLNRVEAISFVD